MSDQTAAEIIAQQQNEITALRQQLDQTKKWGEAGWKRWGLIQDAIAKCAEVEQEL